ncbi:hypothetical protein ACFPRL_11600 [Pseudoclavibacter helvolus]
MLGSCDPRRSIDTSEQKARNCHSNALGQNSPGVEFDASAQTSHGSRLPAALSNGANHGSGRRRHRSRAARANDAPTRNRARR